MTYRVALGPAGLRLEIPALVDGVARMFGLDETEIADWAGAPRRRASTARHSGRPASRRCRCRSSTAEIAAAVREMAPVPVYFGLELVRHPGVIDITPALVEDMVRAGRAANAAGADHLMGPDARADGRHRGAGGVL